MRVTKMRYMLLMCMLSVAIFVPACVGPEQSGTETDKPIANISAWEAYPNIAQAADQTLNIHVTNTQNVGILGAACIASLVHTDSGTAQALDFPPTGADGKTKVMFKTDPSQFAIGDYIADITCIVPGIGERPAQISFSVE